MTGAGSPVVLDVRTATVHDAEAVAALVHSAYRADESRLGWTTEADLVGGQRVDVAMVRALVEAPDSAVLVAGNAAVVACCHVERRGTAAYVGMFAVRPGLQGRGAGRQMLRAAEEHAVGWGADRLELSVLNHRPELIAWYQRCGFSLTGEQHAFPYGDERYGRPLRQDLALLTMVRSLRPPGEPRRP